MDRVVPVGFGFVDQVREVLVVAFAVVAGPDFLGGGILAGEGTLADQRHPIDSALVVALVVAKPDLVEGMADLV